MSKSKRGREKFHRYKKLIIILSKIVSVLPKSIRKRLLVFYRNKRGTAGILIRYILLKTIAKSVGDNVVIYDNVYLHFPEKMEFGNNVSIHPMCHLEAHGELFIGNDVSIAHGTSILTTTHCYSDKDAPVKNQGFESRKTYIGNGVWIGAKATLLYGVNIGDNSIIGANSLVNKNIPEYAVAGGVPAKILKMRV